MLQCVGIIASIVWTHIEDEKTVGIWALIFHVIYFGSKFIVVLVGFITGIVLHPMVTFAFTVVIVSYAIADVALVVVAALYGIEFFNTVATTLGIRTISEPLQWAIIDGSLFMISLYLLSFLVKYMVSMRRYKSSYNARSNIRV